MIEFRDEIVGYAKLGKGLGFLGFGGGWIFRDYALIDDTLRL